MNAEKKTPGAATPGDDDIESMFTTCHYAPAERVPQLIEKFNAAVRAINAAEIERPQFNAWGSVAFAFRRGRLLVVDSGVPYLLTIRPGWDVWRSPGLTREGFQRNELNAGDVLAEGTA